eukprot:scaffold8248_cov258-Pinguiococcus_pyrenoidosus.AAC.2
MTRCVADDYPRRHQSKACTEGRLQCRRLRRLRRFLPARTIMVRRKGARADVLQADVTALPDPWFMHTCILRTQAILSQFLRPTRTCDARLSTATGHGGSLPYTLPLDIQLVFLLLRGGLGLVPVSSARRRAGPLLGRARSLAGALPSVLARAAPLLPLPSAGILRILLVGVLQRVLDGLEDDFLVRRVQRRGKRRVDAGHHAGPLKLLRHGLRHV